MSKNEALKIALAALEGWANHDDWVWPESALEQAKRNTSEAITAIKEALGQTEQEPVAWVGLTDEEVKDVVLDNPNISYALLGLIRDDVTVLIFRQAISDFIRAIEAKLRDKNT